MVKYKNRGPIVCNPIRAKPGFYVNLSPCWTLGPFESTRKHSPKCIQVELDHRDLDLLQEDEEFERQKLVAEIAEELRPQHPQPEAFNLRVCQRKNLNLVSSTW